jgi:hypothetical protein
MKITNTSTSKNKIILLLPYFGKWPEYLNLYFKGCELNQWLDILFITDCEIPEKYPPNVKFIKSNLSIVSNLIAENLGLSGFSLPFSYKLCDFKPSYGCIFKEYIKGYDYWGYGDIDLIYGDLKSKVIHEMEQGFDIISARAEIVSGSFTLIKNNKYNNQLYAKIEDFNIFAINPAYIGLDETSHNSTIWEGLDKLDLPKNCFTYLIAREHHEGHINASFKTFICELLFKFDIVKFNMGEVYYKNQSLGYYHYVMNKGKAYFNYPKWEIIPNTFYITDTGFHKSLWMARIMDLINKGFYYIKRAPNFITRKLRGVLKFNS